MKPIAIVGPTATGKSALAIALAEELGGEVVNADAMQLYRGMDIGTAKVPEEERRGVPHHLLDVLDVTETASVAAYQRDARDVIERLLGQGRVPILTGGSGLYVRAVLDELDFPGTDPDIRARLEQELDNLGAQKLHDRLAKFDPVAATAILPTNGRRVVRALEVIELTGRPFSATMPRPGPARYDTVQLGLDLDTEELDRRVDQRVMAMFEQGLVDEVLELEKKGLRVGKTASRALGYQQVLDQLDADHDMLVATAATALSTRRFVRRQRSWFRRDQRIEWLDAAQDNLVGTALARCLA
ncbi:tRNA (adenosine(37)-N6)-dimethylallyltransferase MiaA [Actinophytocola algeriensis]|uniref:tRNA dimethylallyltransferase n=1 Tax=Actinophytocola algeriensis TaxID=1768010 RepID=A0A7W7Q0Z5_9PSEU|nr:tRNA (adenosine(37)-N6)-dimethylallyltransferase MiaA [Actinophytocola algeriensis]MBB4904864.1 tRNA dimethylallyltransferase [Actinophytocola algeriensis]MBE1476277.1 tRNA dimethylallyltransferase [Actinophytocola algeriensis]